MREDNDPSDAGVELLWDLVGELRGSDDRIVEGSIMSSRCVRVGNEFLAMNHHKKSGLVVKLPASRVAELIAQGTGESFAPAGKVFREWVAVLAPDEQLWRQLLSEGIEFVGSKR